MKSVADLGDLSGKRVLIRCDFNVPLDADKNITDDGRIRAALPTLTALREAGARVVIMAHLGRPKGEVNPKYSLAPVAARLGELLGVDVKLAGDVVGESAESTVASLADGEVALLENVRYEPAEESKDEAARQELAAKYAAFGDLFVSDGFGVVHRKQASVYDVATRLPSAMGGLVAARFATARVRPVRALVLSSPALALKLSAPMLTLHHILLALAPRLRVPNPIDARYLSHDAAVVARYRADPLVQGSISASVLETFLRGMAQAQADAILLEAPTLMLVAGDDRIVDPAGSRRFCDSAPRDLCEARWFDGAYHEIFNEAQPLRGEVFAALADWLRKHLQPQAA